MPRYLTVPTESWKKSREMRRKPTPAEQKLWKAIRRGALNVTFRRQHPIGPYIVDFVCLERKLVVEVDGGGHTEPEQAAYDKTRDEYLVISGFKVQRYFNNDVLQNIDGVVKDVLLMLE